MKIKIATLLTFVFSIAFAQAQDIIIKKNGDEIKCKVMEISSTQVNYKLQQINDSIVNPILSVAKAAVFMIKYENGTKDVFSTTPTSETNTDDYAPNKAQIKKNVFLSSQDEQPITIWGNHYEVGYFNLNPRSVDKIVQAKQNPQINRLIKSAHDDKTTSKILGFSSIGFGVGAYIMLIVAVEQQSNYYRNNNGNSSLAFAGLLCAAGIASVTTSIVLNSQSKKKRKEAVELYNLTYFGK